MTPRFTPDYRWVDVLQCFLPAGKTSVVNFEEMFAERSGYPHAVAFRYGRSGLYFLLKALGHRRKKIVIPAYTCVVVAHAIHESGNIPVFLDNAPGRFQPTPNQYLEAIDEDTVMVIPTHLFGMEEETLAMQAAIRSSYPRVFVLQDCAHSFFCSQRHGRTAAPLGDGALFGMNISKLVNSVRGGMLTLADDGLARDVRCLIQETRNGFDRLQQSFRARLYAFTAALAFSRPGYELTHRLMRYSSLLDSETKYFNENTIELPSDFQGAMLPIQGEFGIRSLRRFEERVQERRKIAEIYFRELASAATHGIELPTNGSTHTWSHFPVRVPADKRNKLRMALERGCNTEVGTIVDYSIPYLMAYRDSHEGEFPESSQAAREVLNLPLTFSEGLTPSSSCARKARQVCQVLIQELSETTNS